MKAPSSAMDKNNPSWVRDELILALDLYFEIDFPRNPSENNPKIDELSKLLNSLPLHKQQSRGKDFRNPTGVYMKLSNFLRFDKSYSGGWRNKGAKLDEEVWNEFAADRGRLRSVAQAITTNYDSVVKLQVDGVGQDEVFVEGQLLTRLHTYHERSSPLIKRKKALVLKETGKLACEACGFDFQAAYGELGRGFAECHHITPLSKLKGTRKTKLSDLAIVCANCHRMLHKSRRWITPGELKELLRFTILN